MCNNILILLNLNQKGSRHPFVDELIEKELNDAKDFLTDYNKKYLDTLTPEEYQEFKSVVHDVVRQYAHPSVFIIAYELIAEALEE